MVSIRGVKPQTKRVKEFLYKVRGIALSRNKYRWAIGVFEKYRRDYEFSDDQLYALALFYDHLAMTGKSAKKKKFKGYLKEAESMYKKVLKRNPSFHLAWYGLGRVWGAKGNFRKALLYQRKAYRMMLKLPRDERGALAVGYFYERLGDRKKAEGWYRKEYRGLKGDFGAALNLFLFYKRVGNYKKVLLYLPVVEDLLKKEFKKNFYKGLKMRDSRFVQGIVKELEEVRIAKGPA